ncbi:MAG: hypothetical protein GF334_04500 [Candidatus Altiarchaeales archaeon]|nr:hypothetical protein [Candidatus Altiarchaeales archaeon]
MSTRANLIISQPSNGLRFYYGISSSGYPECVMPELIEYSGDMGALCDLGLSIRQIGNFDYVYEIDCDVGTIRVWDSTVYWVNAPKDWEWKREGKYGYMNWRKKNRIDISEYGPFSPCDIKIESDDHYTKKDLSSLSIEDISPYYLKKLKYDPSLVRTAFRACSSYLSMYVTPFENIPLLIHNSDDEIKSILSWRLQIGK